MDLPIPLPIKKNFVLKINLFIASAFISAQTAFAQTDTTQQLPEVQVQSERIQIPFSQQNRTVRIITKEEIARMPAKSISDVLSTIAGLDVRQRGPNGTQADLHMDGGGFDQTLILINGVKMSDSQTGHNMMVLPIPLQAIERIEVLKGAAARIYGLNALQGAVNIVTKKATHDGLLAETYAGSSFTKDDSTKKAYINYGLSLGGTFNNKWSGHLLSIGYDHGNGYRYNTAYKNFKGFYQGAFRIHSKAEAVLSAGYTANDFGANQFYAAPKDVEAVEKTKVGFLATELTYKPQSNWLIKASVNYRNGNDDYIFTRKKPEIYHNIHRTQVWEGRLNSSLTLGKSAIGLGFVLRNERINSNNLGQDSRNNYGSFFEYRYHVSKNLAVHLGAFANYNSHYGWQVYPGIDIGYQLSDDWRLYAQWGSGQRLPTFTDLYYKGPINNGNPDLLPERAQTAELGTKGRLENLRVQFSAFYHAGNNFIDWMRTDTSAPWKPENILHVQTLGAQIFADYSIDFNENKGLALHSGYIYLHPQLKDNPNFLSKYVINSLQHQWINKVDARLGNAFSVYVQHRFVKRWHSKNTIDGIKHGSYHLLDLRANYRLPALTFYCDVQNLFNITYVESGVVPLPGRWTTLGMRLEL